MTDDMNEQTEIQNLRQEIRRLKDLNDLQNEQLTQLNRNSTEHNNVSNQLIRALVDGLRGINIDVKQPNFDEARNPKQFIEKLENNFDVKNVTIENYLI